MIHCVVSRYKKNVDWVYNLKNIDKIYIYDKETPENEYNVPVNKGQEASVYLKYIVDHYNHLADFTFFTHDEEYSWHHSGSIINKLDEAVDSKQLYYNINDKCANTMNEIKPINNDNELLKELVATNKILTSKVSSLENSMQQILNKLNEKETKIVTGFNQQLPHLGPRLQKINPETLQLIKVYESVTEVMNENKNIKRPSIMKAIQENTIYCGFRWLLVERNVDPNIIHDIQPTKETKIINSGYIAKLNKEKTEIVNVYLDRKTAAQLNGYQSSSALDNPVKNNTIANGNYYLLYSNCDEELINAFEEKNGAPLLYKDGIGKFDANNHLVQEFTCKYECIRQLKMSDKTLAKALNQNIMYNGFYFKQLGAKLKQI